MRDYLKEPLRRRLGSGSRDPSRSPSFIIALVYMETARWGGGGHCTFGSLGREVLLYPVLKIHLIQ